MQKFEIIEAMTRIHEFYEVPLWNVVVSDKASLVMHGLIEDCDLLTLSATTAAFRKIKNRHPSYLRVDEDTDEDILEGIMEGYQAKITQGFSDASPIGVVWVVNLASTLRDKELNQKTGDLIDIEVIKSHLGIN